MNDKPMMTAHDPDNAGDQFNAQMAMDAHPANIALAVDDYYGGMVLVQDGNYINFSSWERLIDAAALIENRPPNTPVIFRQGEFVIIVPPIPEAIDNLLEMLRDTAKRWKDGEFEIKLPRKK